MPQTDARYADLYGSARRFLERHGLHPDPIGYLGHGYVQLFLAAWRGATGEPLELAACWGLWTWRLDDILDQEMRDAEPKATGLLVARLLRVLNGVPAEPGDHPAVRALADLVERTRPAMPESWWTRYSAELDAWLHAATDKLEGFVRPRRTPTLRQYMALRPVDGGMLLAAMWCELAMRCVTPDWDTLAVRSLLGSFSAVGTLANDLASSAQDDTFTAQDALAHTIGLTVEKARQRVREQLEAESRRFWWQLTALWDSAVEARTTDPRDPPPASTTVRFALALDQFQHALTAWTAHSARYRPVGAQNSTQVLKNAGELKQ
ncbi:terpene synthase family protein [Kitasatospora kifunensis]|uniref:Terpene synthase n=1 Tax=Kitasatospora kifunensis TaxID=58351 RepID=A0A7W7R3R8_KITKI|nr:terpene synthase family protein [Kitasatospora kifunensis]MBB4924933.1 hypothetical protein [Kitasatospora kifunensis]